MKRLMTVMVAAFLAATGLAFAGQPVGSISYLEGTVAIVRGGKTIQNPQIGDDLENFDLVKTGKNATVEIAVGEATGMAGTITVRPSTTFQLKTAKTGGEPKSTLEVMTGKLGIKVKKLAGKPTMSVRTETTTLGVRGTTFGIVTSVQGDVLVTCEEGDVAVSDGDSEADAVPGTVIARLAGSPLAPVAVSVDSLKGYEDTWIAERIDAFRANAYQAIRDYADRYATLSLEFSRAMDKLAQNRTFNKWVQEDRQGTVPYANDPAVMKEKTDVIGSLYDVQKNLVIFERVYYRVLELSGYASKSILGNKLPRYGTVRGFLNQVEREKIALGSRMAMFHYAEALFAARNNGSVGGLIDSGDGDFFDSAQEQDSFFNN